MASGLRERQITKFIEHEKIQPHGKIGKPPLSSGSGFCFQSIDEINHGKDPTSSTTTDAGPRDGDRKMAFAGPGAADQNGIALCRDKFTTRQVTRHGRNRP